MSGKFKRFISTLLVVTVSSVAYCQRAPKAPADTTRDLRDSEVRAMVEIPAEYPGGMHKFYDYVRKNIRYPKKAKKHHLHGNVYVEFILDSDGSIIDNTVKPVKIERLGKAAQPLLDPECQEEAVRLIKESMKWSPATRNGKPEQQAMVISIPFIL
jgi:protein TonB